MTLASNGQRNSDMEGETPTPFRSLTPTQTVQEVVKEPDTKRVHGPFSLSSESTLNFETTMFSVPYLSY